MTDVGGVLFHNRRRVNEIADVLARYNLARLASAFGTVTGERPSRFPLNLLDSRMVDMTTGQRLRQAMIELGTTWIKLGQMLSLRADLVGPDVAAELRQLQNAVPADAPGLAVAAVEAELGAPVEELFASFESEPMASGSVAQVHGAVLHDGTAVVVKVLHHDADRRVRGDLELMRVLARAITAIDPGFARVNAVAVVAEFDAMMRAAIDFTHELAHMRQLGQNLARESDIVVPRPYPELCSPRVLTMERLYGASVATRESLESAGWQVERFVHRTSDVFLAMIFRDGIFHADPHPGNFLLPDAGHLALLDFGDIGYLTSARRIDFQTLLLAIAERDAEDFTHALMEVTRAGSEVDVERLQTDVETWMQRYLAAGVGEQDLGPAVEGLLELIRSNAMTFPSDLLMPLRVLMRLQGLGLELGSTVALDDMLRPYLTQMMVDKMSPAALLRQARRAFRSWERLLGPLPDELSGMAGRLRRDGLSVDVKLHDPDEVIDKLIDGLLASASIVAASELLSRKTPPTLKDTSLPGVFTAAMGALLWRRLQARRASHRSLPGRVVSLIRRH